MNTGDLSRGASAYGLVLRGGFQPAPEDDVPEIQPDVPALTLALFGNAGSSIWSAFSSSPEYADGSPDPLDRWSRRVGEALAARWQGAALFPFGGPPWHPFMRWAMEAEGLLPSRLGMLIHPRYGLWHAYRFAVALPVRVNALQGAEPGTRACEACSTQPCLQSCPVDAFDGVHYDVSSCVTYLKSRPEAPCHDGCLARGACPEGKDYRYLTPHAGFHMERFFLAQLARRDP